MSVIVKSAGGGSAKPELFTYVLQTASGDEGLLQYKGVEEVTLTAVAEDIKIGKVAINEEGVVTGTHVCPTVKELTADADATAGDIRANKTAYVNGVKVTGTLVSGEYSVFETIYQIGTIYYRPSVSVPLAGYKKISLACLEYRCLETSSPQVNHFNEVLDVVAGYSKSFSIANASYQLKIDDNLNLILNPVSAPNGSSYSFYLFISVSGVK